VARARVRAPKESAVDRRTKETGEFEAGRPRRPGHDPSSYGSEKVFVTKTAIWPRVLGFDGQ
jgi:hypothetical protein